MNLKNSEVEQLQKRLQDIIQNIEANMEIINDKTISDNFLFPIMKLATKISDDIFVQTKDTVNHIEVK